MLIKESHSVNQLREFLYKVIICYKKLNNFDAVLAGNFVYTQQQELLVVLKKIKIPSLIIYKEGMLPIAKFKTAKDFLYKTKVFRADHIMFYNDFIRDTLVETNMKGLSFEKTTVVGLPRFDKYFNSKFEKKSNQIVLFSFEPNEKGNYLLEDQSYFPQFENEVTKFHLLFAKFCEENKEFNLVVKTKGSDRAKNYAKKIYDPFVKKLSNRLIITSDIKADNLVENSSFIAGFSSTTLIEGLASNKRIICPKFSNTIFNHENDLLHPYQQLASYILEYSELLNIFEKDVTIDKVLKEKFICERVFKDDGNASIRAEQCIVDVINNFKKDEEK